MKLGRKSTQEKGLIISPREQQVLTALGKGLMYKEVAMQLHISQETVRSHATRMYKRLQVRNSKQALIKVRAIEQSTLWPINPNVVEGNLHSTHLYHH